MRIVRPKAHGWFGRRYAKSKRHFEPLVAKATLARLLIIILLTLHGTSSAQDLPFESGSTGADGPLPLPVYLPPGTDLAVYESTRQVMLFRAATNQLWKWDGTTFSRVTQNTNLMARFQVIMAHDPDRRETLLFSGSVSTADTWVWNGTNWTQRLPATNPPVRTRFSMVYDSARRNVVLYGGLSDQTGQYLDDTWSWDGSNWTRMNSPNSPGLRFGHAMAYDEVRRQTVLFGGLSNGVYVADTWILDGTNWNQKQLGLGLAPPAQVYSRMSYDVRRERILLTGGEDRNGQIEKNYWEWDGTNWSRIAPLVRPSVRSRPALAYDSVRGLSILAGGFSQSVAFGTTIYHNDAWSWDGTNWVFVAGQTQMLDVSSKPDATWNFTTINLPADRSLGFYRNQMNLPVRLLATAAVSINGRIDASGEPGGKGGPDAEQPRGGPGGFSGGLGGEPHFPGGTYAGSPGLGPGGGRAGVGAGEPGQPGRYASVYGNAMIEPLMGGSGGGGNGSGDGIYGESGGGGGGGILIASSRDMVVGGQIFANGGAGFGGSPSGSGGGIRLRADRISLSSSASLRAIPDGRIRIESYERSLLGEIQPNSFSNVVISAPAADLPGPVGSQLRIVQVHGLNVSQPPGSDLLHPDVLFSAPGDIAVIVEGQNIPNGTPVRLRVTMIGAVIEKPAMGETPTLLSGGTATFTLSVPRGRGTLQAFAEFTVP